MEANTVGATTMLTMATTIAGIAMPEEATVGEIQITGAIAIEVSHTAVYHSVSAAS